MTNWLLAGDLMTSKTITITSLIWLAVVFTLLVVLYFIRKDRKPRDEAAELDAMLAEWNKAKEKELERRRTELDVITRNEDYR